MTNSLEGLYDIKEEHSKVLFGNENSDGNYNDKDNHGDSDR